MLRCLNGVIMVGVLLLTGCTQHLPSLSITGVTSTAGSGPPRVTDVTNQIACELYSIDTSVVPKHRDKTTWAFTDIASNTGSLYNLTHGNKVFTHEDMANFVSYLNKYHFVASVNLTLDVTDNEGLDPALSFITPFNKMKAFGNSFALGVGGQLSGTQDRKMTLAYPIDLATLPAANLKCAPTNNSALQVIGLDSGLKGNLGLGDIVADGLVALETSAKYSYYGSSGGGAPVTTVYEPLDLTKHSLIPLKPEPPVPGHHAPRPAPQLGLSEFKGYISFGPPVQAGPAQRSVTLSGIFSFDKGQCNGTLTGSMEATAAGTQLPFFVTGPMSWMPTLPPPAFDPQISKLCDGTTKAVAAGLVDSNFMKQATPSLKLAFYSDGKGYFPTNGDAVATDLLVYSPPANAAQTAAIPQIVIPSFNAFGVTTYGAFAQSALAVGPAPASAGASGSSPSASASGTGTSFGSSVDFTVVYGLNGGPTWTLTHFKGPQAGSGSLVNLSRQVVDSLTITFVPACQNASDVQPTVSSYWDTLPPCNASSFANAAATAQGFNALQQTSTSP